MAGITYQHRIGLLKTGNLWHVAVGIGVSEHIDWNKNNRGFKDKQHFDNWLRMIANKFNLGLDDFTETFNELITDGWFRVKRVNGKAYKIWRTLPDTPAVDEDGVVQDGLKIVGLD